MDKWNPSTLVASASSIRTGRRKRFSDAIFALYKGPAVSPTIHATINTYVYSHVSVSHLTCPNARGKTGTRSSPQRSLHALDTLPSKQALNSIRDLAKYDAQ